MNEMNLAEIWKRVRGNHGVVGYSGALKRKIVGGVETPELAIRIYVKRKLPLAELAPDGVIPLEIEGVKTDVVEVGELRALGEDPKKHYRPAPAGCSAIYEGGTACSIGFFAHDNRDGEIVIIANNHCTCGSNKLKLGHPYVQPSPYDGAAKKLGALKRFVPIVFEEFTCKYRQLITRTLNPFFKSVYNKVDLGLISVDPDDIKLEILNIGEVRGKRRGVVGEKMMKMGRTTGFTKDGVLVDNDYYGDVGYSRGTASFGPCALISKHKFSQGGDSSSAVLCQSDKFFSGLLFAGSDSHTLFCLWDLIECEGDVEIVF